MTRSDRHPRPALTVDCVVFGVDEEDFVEGLGFCSGFIVAPDVVLTASHCLHGPAYLEVNTDFEVVTDDGVRHRPARLLGFDVQRDYLLLEVPGLERYGVLELSADVRVGEPVYTIGHSNRSAAALIGLLKAHAVRLLVDIRAFPRSRRFPRSNDPPNDRLAESRSGGPA